MDSPTKELKAEPGLSIPGEASFRIAGPFNLFIDMQVNNYSGIATLNAEEATQLRDWLNRVLP